MKKKEKKNRLKDLIGKINERMLKSKKKSIEDREELIQIRTHQTKTTTRNNTEGKNENQTRKEAVEKKNGIQGILNKELTKSHILR